MIRFYTLLITLLLSLYASAEPAAVPAAPVVAPAAFAEPIEPAAVPAVSAESIAPAAGQEHTIMFLNGLETAQPYEESYTAYFNKLQELGFTRDANLKVKYANVENTAGKAQNFYKYNSDNIELILTNGTIPSLAMKELLFGQNLPVIFLNFTDPVGGGVIRNFTEPPMANFTGVSYPVPVDVRLRFVRKLLPNVKTIGVIHSDMPQAMSYVKWLNELQATPEFNNLAFQFRMIPLVKSEKGTIRMADTAIQYVKELEPIVDVFLSSNCSFGASVDYSKMIAANTNKLTVGLSGVNVANGEMAAVAPDSTMAGQQAAIMTIHILNGGQVKDIKPETTKNQKIFLNEEALAAKGFNVPELKKELNIN